MADLFGVAGRKLLADLESPSLGAVTSMRALS
jgi:hypothetical protein